MVSLFSVSFGAGKVLVNVGSSVDPLDTLLFLPRQQSDAWGAFLVGSQSTTFVATAESIEAMRQTRLTKYALVFDSVFVHRTCLLIVRVPRRASCSVASSLSIPTAAMSERSRASLSTRFK